MATVDNVLALSKNLSILHFATHTFFVPGHPELSGIALSPEKGASEGKSILWLHDIPALHAPHLVTLSGCATQGQGLGGEELSALTQAFFYAGAHEVIGTIWSVDDETTAALMEHFYRGLIAHHMKAIDALRLAQLDMLRTGANLSDWAGFVIDGVPAGAGTVDTNQMTGNR
jgi:CHAT domain-containing protein